jgi:hypothetical protein
MLTAVVYIGCLQHDLSSREHTKSSYVSERNGVGWLHLPSHTTDIQQSLIGGELHDSARIAT